MADIVDRRIFLIGTQIWTVAAASLLAVLTLTGGMTAGWLLILTFAIGIGAALTQPAWSAIIPELVPREDLIGAITLNGIGFNLTRAVTARSRIPDPSGRLRPRHSRSTPPPSLAVIVALVMWRRGRRFSGLPREHLISAMRAGMRFVRNTPAIQHAMIRTIAYSIPASAPWALLPLHVRWHDLDLGPRMAMASFWA